MHTSSPDLDGARIGFTRIRTSVADGIDRPNYGLAVGDDPQAVLADRRSLAHLVGSPIVWMEQTHSDCVAVNPPADPRGKNAVQADAVIVASGAAAVQVADCVPILMSADRGRWVAAVHAGRRGIEQCIVGKAVRALRDLGAESISAWVGPCICGKCYEVDEKTFRACTQVLPVLQAQSRWGTRALDLRAGVNAQLNEAGVDNIHHREECTLETPDLHSYRRYAGCGRQVGWIQTSDL
ncbi:polyphenol oxidase family protein [Gleimia hominis]|uniref:polyphenol oxidase family protein n=1 Tax=Gleimia hominis TaxID=595468 RepID=UPI000C80585A|nr:polyphenol oxidase family protein [Gleimia hominis]WIK65233.1 polyphenol oxidase family protein [Gleimia hominis]